LKGVSADWMPVPASGADPATSAPEPIVFASHAFKSLPCEPHSDAAACPGGLQPTAACSAATTRADGRKHGGMAAVAASSTTDMGQCMQGSAVVYPSICPAEHHAAEPHSGTDHGDPRATEGQARTELVRWRTCAAGSTLRIPVRGSRGYRPVHVMYAPLPLPCLLPTERLRCARADESCERARSAIIPETCQCQNCVSACERACVFACVCACVCAYGCWVGGWVHAFGICKLCLRA
jgi:hypothetical protein